jgi:hypothetical protein
VYKSSYATLGLNIFPIQVYLLTLDYLLIDWLPTLMGQASNGEWKGSLTDTVLDGYDMWDSIMMNSSSPRHEIVHYADGQHTMSLQVDEIKLILGITSTPFTTPLTSFQEDLLPNNSYMKCSVPSLVNAASFLSDDDDNADVDSTDDHAADPRNHQRSILVIIFDELVRIMSVLVIALAALGATISLILALHTCKCMIEERFFPKPKRKPRKVGDKIIFHADAVASSADDSHYDDIPVRKPIDPEYAIPASDPERDQYIPIDDANEETSLLKANL